ncbi:LacI family transcriptional regulator [Paenibacillaceae bacterium]|nr:LacI family transcriptional regulator [Paenibacillaceae bacterium]
MPKERNRFNIKVCPHTHDRGGDRVTVTIREIAERAGVSRGTVDRVLNGRERVKPEVREKVLAIAKQLNYVPNLAAKALAFSKNPVRFGIIMPPEEIRFYDEIRSGIDEAAEELKDLGIRLDYYYVDNTSPEEAAQTIRQLVQSGANGILFSVMDDQLIRTHIDQAADLGVPVVTFNSDVENSRRVCFVGQDLQKSGRVAAGLMCSVTKPQAKVAIVTGNLRFHAHRMRVEGFRQGVLERGGQLDIIQTVEGFDRYTDTYNQLIQLLEEHTDLTGIYMATGSVKACIDALRQSGREGTVRVVCNDLLPEIQQGLQERIIDFTIVQNPKQQGYRALRILYDLIFTGKHPEAKHYYTEMNICIPESL